LGRIAPPAFGVGAALGMYYVGMRLTLGCS
jgi:hypothetical protein